jgi:predicted metal-dependent hydrolase
MTLTIEDLVIPVKHSANRKTMQLTVNRDSSLLLTAPPFVQNDVLEGFVRSKLSWVYQKLAEKSLMPYGRCPKTFY